MKPQHNTWVDNLLGLYQNSILGNADNRGLDSEFARETYVDTALDTSLLPSIIAGEFKAVFLTGNPGDGKTAFLEKVFARLKYEGAKTEWKDSSGWELTLSGTTYIACYDASESFNGVSSDDRLKSLLRPLAGDTEPQSSRIILVAINDGKLHSFFHQHRSQFRWLSKTVLNQAFRKQNGQRNAVVVVNLKERALVDLGIDETNSESSIFDLLLRKFSERSKWSICESCSSQTRCPIFANARSLGWGPASKQARTRIKLLFALSHIRRRRHNTMRDIRSALSFIVTSNLRCDDVHLSVEETRGDNWIVKHRYFDSIFNAKDETLSEFQELDPASTPLPKLDRRLAQLYNQNRVDEFSRIFYEPDHIKTSTRDSKELTEWISSARRLMYFEADPARLLEAFDGIQDPWDLLPYWYLRFFIGFLQNTGDTAVIMEQLVRGISQLEGIRDNRIAKDFLLVRVTQSPKEGLTICRKFPTGEFDLFVDFQKQPFIESVPDQIIFKHRTTGVHSIITLDLFELLIRMASGLLPGSEEQQVVLDEISEFKSRLHRIQTRNLLLIETNGEVHHVTQQDGTIVRLQEA